MNDKLLIALMFLIMSPFIATLAEAAECRNESPWGEIVGAFAGAWAGNQLGGSGLWTIAGAVGGAYAGEKVEQAITCKNNQVKYESDAERLCRQMGYDNPTCWAK